MHTTHPTTSASTSPARSATVQALLHAGAKVDQADSNGWTVLICAAFAGHTATVQALLDGQANCSLKATNGATALSLAIKWNHQEVIDLLRRNAASTTQKRKGIFGSWFG